MSEETQTVLIGLERFLSKQPTILLGTDESTMRIQADMLARHARSMIMMYRATKTERYLQQAKQDIRQAYTILRSGFVRPLGVVLKESA